MPQDRKRIPRAKGNASTISGDPLVDAALWELTEVLAEIALNPKGLQDDRSSDVQNPVKLDAEAEAGGPLD